MNLEEVESGETEASTSESGESETEQDEAEQAEPEEVEVVDRTLSDEKLKNILEATLMAVGKPMSMEQLMKLFEDEERPSASRVKEQLSLLQSETEGRGVELREVATGYRYQARQEYSEWLSRLWEEKPAKYSRAYLETLALIAYRQPVTRAEIEEVRGVSVSSHIIKTMLEREWIRVVGHRDVPGRPSLYATTKQFLDYFNMKSLDELPSLAEIKDLDELNPELQLEEPGAESDSAQQDELADDVDLVSDSDSEAEPEVESDAEFDSHGEAEDSAEQELSEITNPEQEEATLLGESEQDADAESLDVSEEEFDAQAVAVEAVDSEIVESEIVESDIVGLEEPTTADPMVEETINELLHQEFDNDAEDSSTFDAVEDTDAEIQSGTDGHSDDTDQVN